MTSCVVTLFNEEDSVVSLLEALTSQTRKIDEVIIVDAKSTDSTVGIIKNFIKEKKVKNIKFLSKKGNRSVGRNFGIKNCRGNIILVTDAGCIPDKNWVKFLLDGFKKDIDVVSGFYYSGAKTPFEKALSTYTCVMTDRVDRKNFLPSSRSVAFKKTAWKGVGGYPERLDTCEDLVFAKNLKRSGNSFYFEKKAFVIWPQKKNIYQAFIQFYGYAKGDGQALYIRSQTPLLFGRYVIGLLLFALSVIFNSTMLLIFLFVGFGAYLLWAIAKNQKYVKSRVGYVYLPLLQVVSDAAVLFGMTVGLFSRAGFNT